MMQTFTHSQRQPRVDELTQGLDECVCSDCFQDRPLAF